MSFVGEIQSYLHVMGDDFFVLQDLLKSARAEYVAQRGGGQETRRELSILDIRHRHDRIAHAEIAHGIDRYCHRVLRTRE